MKGNLEFLQEFDALRNVCEDNPPHYIQNHHHWQGKYPRLQSAHFRLLEAYAHIKLARFEQSEPIITDILSKAVLCGDLFLMVHGNLLLSQCFRSDVQKAQSCLKLAEEYSRKAEDPLLLAESMANQGDYHFFWNNFKAAEEYHLQVQKLLQTIEYPKLKMRSLLAMANTMRALKKPERVLQYLYAALELGKRHGNQHFTLIVYNRLAMILTELKRFTEAEETLHNSIKLCDEHGFVLQKIQSIFSLAVNHLENKQFELALIRLDECSTLAMNQNFEAPAFLMDLYNNYAVAYAKLNDIDTALKYLEKAAEYAHDKDEYEIMLNAAQMLIEVKRYEDAKVHLQRCLKASKANKNEEFHFQAADALAKLYLKTREYPKCVDMMQKVQTLLTKKLEENQSEKDQAARQNFDANKTQLSMVECKPICKTSTPEFIGDSEAFKRVKNAALLAAQHPQANVILIGESGTGKEVIANLIHRNSIRKYNPFIPINAAAISASLVESELFGHTKGSYTGAHSDTKGFFLQANKGTLFIDEITEMPMEFQSKLLRALESHKVTPVGSSLEVPFDCRIISSTNRNVYELIKSNQFRLDLFHRINTIEIFIPPLRSRIDDIPVLVQHFINVFSPEFGGIKPTILPSFLNTLQEYDFPGNVRELKNIVERLFILGESLSWDADLLRGFTNMKQDTRESVSPECQDEKERIIKALIRHNGMQKDAAKELNFSDSTMSRRITKFQLEGYTRKGM